MLATKAAFLFLSDLLLGEKVAIEQSKLYKLLSFYDIILNIATVPDFFYEPRNDAYEGLCIYLDGMSSHLHGSPETRDKDREVREELRNRGYEVVEIQFGQLTDPNAMRQHFFRIGRFLLGREAAQQIRESSSWCVDPSE